jgi:hypothetical protein
MATSQAGRVLQVAVVSHHLRCGKVLDVDDPFGGICYVLTRSEHRGLLWKRVGTGSIEAIVWPVYIDPQNPRYSLEKEPKNEPEITDDDIPF